MDKDIGRKNPKKIRHAFLLWQQEYTKLKLPPREHKRNTNHTSTTMRYEQIYKNGYGWNLI